MADDFKRAQRAAVLENPSSVLAGLFFCGVTIWGVEAQRSLGILIVALVLITTTALVRAFVPRPLLQRDTTKTVLMTALCSGVTALLTGLVLAQTGVVSSPFVLVVLMACLFSAPFAHSGRFMRTSGVARVFFTAAGLVFALSYFAALTMDLVILILCLACVAVVLLDLSFDRRALSTCESRFNAPLVCGQSGGNALLSSGDIWVALMVLPLDQSLMYCGARLWVMLAQSTLRGFDRMVAPAVTEAFYDAPRAVFVGTMARVNLSLFLIGSAAGVVVLMGREDVLNRAFHLNDQSNEIVLYLLCGIIVPVIFGFMDTTSKILVPPPVSAGMCLIGMVAGAAAFAGQGVETARALAVGYCVWNSVCAILHSGYWGINHAVWPGPTALFARQIRLLR